MRIEQRKISLINWMMNLEDETLIGYIERIRNSSSSEIPQEIFMILEMSAAAKKDECIEHTDSRTILGRG
ncbi:MAG: hypothetical protein K9G46_01590 [Flavobacteriales bacterium]|jgi:hypothetical protein|nr:hypothetical protein [Flavobacteriales bacterium]